MWLYAVAEDTPAARPSQLAGVGGLAVRAIASAGLTAIASNVPLDEFGEDALRGNLEDMTWLEGTATAHHRVIEQMSRAQPVVPLRFATIYSGDAKVRAMLGQRGGDLRDVLRRIRTRREWGVKAYAAGSPGGPAGANGARSGRGLAGSGAAYLRRRRDELAASKQHRQEALVSAERVHQKLSQLASASRLYPPQVPVLAGTKATMILNAAYLLDQARDQQFSELLQQLGGQNPAVQLELSGPWPPYSFAGLDMVVQAGDGQ